MAGGFTGNQAFYTATEARGQQIKMDLYSRNKFK